MHSTNVAESLALRSARAVESVIASAAAALHEVIKNFPSQRPDQPREEGEDAADAAHGEGGSKDQLDVLAHRSRPAEATRFTSWM